MAGDDLIHAALPLADYAALPLADYLRWAAYRLRYESLLLEAARLGIDVTLFEISDSTALEEILMLATRVRHAIQNQRLKLPMKGAGDEH